MAVAQEFDAKTVLLQSLLRRGIATLLHSFALQVLRRLDPGFRGTAVRLSNEDPVVKLMNSERHIVMSYLRFFARGLQLGPGHIVGWLDFQERGQWLRDLRPAGRKVASPLVEDAAHRRYGRPPCYSQAAGCDLDQLRIRHMCKGRISKMIS